MFAASFNATVTKSFRDRGLYEAGSDARLVNLPSQLSGTGAFLSEELEKESGVIHAAAVYRRDSQGEGVQMLGLDTINFHQVSFYRDDFSDAELFALMRHIDRGRSITRGLELPPETRAIGIWVRPAQSYLGVTLWGRIRDGQGQSWGFRMGRLDTKEWTFFEGSAETFTGEPLPEPLVLESLFLRELDFPDQPAPAFLARGQISSAQMHLSDLTAFVRGEQQGRVISNFQTPRGWAVMATSISSPEVLAPSADIEREGKPTTEFSWKSSPGLGLRGIFPAETTEPLPILASQRYLGSIGRNVGDTIEVTVNGIPVPVRVADMLNYFPTLDPARPFVVGNSNTLLYYANLFLGGAVTVPNEVWLSLTEDEGAREAAIEGLIQSRYGRYLVDSNADAKALKIDPLVGAGSQGAVFSIALVLLVVGIGGYLGYLYVASYRTPLEFAVLRSLGFSSRSLLQLQLLVHGTMLFLAAFLGGWLGARAQGVMVQFLAHSERGEQISPPLSQQTEWIGLMVVLGLSTLVLVAVAIWQVRAYKRVAIWRVLRGSGE